MASAGAQNPLFEQFYNFPPFFTLQPTPTTRTNQLDLWTKLIQSSCRRSNQFVLTRSEQIFTNANIKRSLSNDFISELFTHMVASGAAMPNTREQGVSPASSPKSLGIKTKPLDSVIVLFLPKEKWYERLYDYAKRNGLVGGIATAYEILNDDEFQGMDAVVLEVLLRGMQREQKNCEVMVGSGGVVEGVKFF